MKIYLSLTIESEEGANIATPKVSVRKTDSEVELRVVSESEEPLEENSVATV